MRCPDNVPPVYCPVEKLAVGDEPYVVQHEGTYWMSHTCGVVTDVIADRVRFRDGCTLVNGPAFVRRENLETCLVDEARVGDHVHAFFITGDVTFMRGTTPDDHRVVEVLGNQRLHLNHPSWRSWPGVFISVDKIVVTRGRVADYANPESAQRLREYLEKLCR